MLACDSHRVLVAAGLHERDRMRQLFDSEPLSHWDMLEAESFSQARFVLQHNPCDLIVINSDLYESEGSQGLAWLAWQRQAPVVFLAGPSAEQFQRAYELGIPSCLPRDLVLSQPTLLLAAMEQALRQGQQRAGYQRARLSLTECRRHVDRLVHLMWRSAQKQADYQWCSQRYMLERLHEEVCRVERHKIPLTVAVGEMQTDPSDDTETRTLPDWATEMIAKSKRRCDVVGQYGPNGFMLLMVQTPIKGGMTCVRRLQKSLEHPPQPDGTPPPTARLRAYFGITSTAANKASSVTLLRTAEQNLEAARADADERIVVD